MKTLLARSILICIGLIGMSLVFTNVGSTEIDPHSVIAAFLFDDVTTTGAKDLVLDWSGNRNHGEVKVGKVRVVDGKFGRAIEFPVEKDACIDLGKPLLSNLSAFTIVAWINKMGEVPIADWPPEAWAGQHDVIEWYMNLPNSVLVMTYPTTEKQPEPNHAHGHPHHRDGCPQPKDCVWNSLKLPADAAGIPKWNESGTFVHMAVTGDRNNLIMYRNGRSALKKKVNNLAQIGPLVTYGYSEENTHIGGCGVNDFADGGKGNYFDGLMDEVAFFNVALAKEDIINIRDNGLESIGLIGRTVEPADKLAVTWGELKQQ